MAKSGGNLRRRDLWRPGGVEVLLLVVLAGVLVLPSLLVHADSEPAFTTQKRAIDRAESTGPINTPQWQVDDLGFARAEVPGTIRKVELDNPSGTIAAAGTHVDTIVVGGHGAGVAIVKLPVGDPAQLLEPLTDDLRDLGDALGVASMSDFEIIDFHPRPERRYAGDGVLDLGQAYSYDLTTGEYSLRSEATFEGQTLRVRTAMVGKHPVLIASIFPAGRPDPVIDRVTRSLKAS